MTAVLVSLQAAWAAPVGIGPSFRGPVGLQLYSLREQFGKHVPGTLDEVRRFGIQVQKLAGTYGLSPEKFKQELAARGIRPIGAHFPYEDFRKDPEAIARQAEALGLKYAGCASIPTTGPLTKRPAARRSRCSTRPVRCWRNTG